MEQVRECYENAVEIEWWMIENFGDGVKKDRAQRERERERGVGFWCEEVVSAIIWLWFGFCGAIFELFELVNVMIIHVCLNKSSFGTCNLRDVPYAPNFKINTMYS